MQRSRSQEPGPTDEEPTPEELRRGADAAVAQVREWLELTGRVREPASVRQLASLLRDAAGPAFAVAFVDGVVRPEDPAAAATVLRRIGRRPPRALPLHLRTAVRLGGAVAPLAPGVVVPLARAAFRRLVGHQVVDARPERLRAFLADERSSGVALNLNLLGEAVLGQAEAERRLAGVRALVQDPDVHHVSVKVSALTGPHAPWGHDATVEETVATLLPLFRLAAEGPTRTCVMLDMEEFRDLDLTLDVFTQLMAHPELHGLTAGVVIQAYLPDSGPALDRLQRWATQRVDAGGAPVRVRIVKGANLLMERVDAEVHGWPQAPWPSKLATDAHHLRLLHRALTSTSLRSLQVGVATHNLFDVAYAWQLARARGAADGVTFEMLRGMAPREAEAVRRSVGSLLLYVPLVRPAEFDVAVAYLVRRLDEGASEENYLSRAPWLGEDRQAFEVEERRFRDAVRASTDPVPGTMRTQDRTQPPDPRPTGEEQTTFGNAPDSDPALGPNRRWATSVLDRARELVSAPVNLDRLDDPEAVAGACADVRRAGAQWQAYGSRGRAEVLLAFADEAERRRGDLIAVMAAECHKTVDQADPEVSETIDFARYYAQRCVELDEVAGARATPVGLTVVTPPWNFPVAIPAGEMLSALATGSGVVLKPAPEARRCGALLGEIARTAGVPPEVLRVLDVGEQEAGRALVAGDHVGRVLLTGAWSTAQLFRSWRSDLPLLAETSGKNAVVVTASADVDLAVRDVVASAFSHAGQKCSAASLVILVGSAARSPRFRRQLVDAVRSLRVGSALDASAQVAPLIRPADGALLRGLTTLEPGETWWVPPRRLDPSGQVWSPGVKGGVRPGSTTHLTEFFGPLLGVMEADDLDEALALQNAVDYGLTAGLHSLDPDEVEHWAAGVHVGNLYVNRGTTGAVVRRQPFGGWKRSSVGAGWKAGGPHRLHGLVDWSDAPLEAVGPLDPTARALLRVGAASGLTPEQVAWLEGALSTDRRAWQTLATPVDPSGLRAESNVLRHLPASVAVRVGSGAEPVHVLRVLAAARRSGADCVVSLDPAADDSVEALVGRAGWTATVESTPTFVEGLVVSGRDRVRRVGGSVTELAAAMEGRTDATVFAQPVVTGGEVELLPFVQEQAISVTAHRHGTPSPWVRRLSWVV